MAKPFVRFLELHAAGGSILLLSTIVALVLSNSPWADPFLDIWEVPASFQLGSFEFSRSMREWINDGLMTVFFFLVSMELKRELVLGELRTPRMAALSIAAALGGMLIPALIFLTLQGGQSGQEGWGLVMATDTAFVIAALVLLGPRIPQSLHVFMLSLAIVDDVGAILVVAIGYSEGISLIALALAALGLAAIRLMAFLGFRKFPGFIVAGVLVWLAMDASGIHATITGVILGLMTPARRWVSDERLYSILGQVIAHPESEEGSGDTRDRETLQIAEIAAREALSPIERLEFTLHPWVAFAIMPLFALANAGLDLSIDALSNPLTMAVLVGFVVGKPLGIITFSYLAVRLGWAIRPPELNWKLIAGGGMLAGIGFTMALFIAGLSLPPELLDSGKMGIFLGSIFSAAAGVYCLLWTTRGTDRKA